MHKKYGNNYEIRKCIKCDTFSKINKTKYLHHKYCKDCWANLRVKCITCDDPLVHLSVKQCLRCCNNLFRINVMKQSPLEIL